MHILVFFLTIQLYFTFPDGVQINDYTEMFSAHLRLCVIKQTLPVAADIVEFMLIHGMVPETLQLQNLIHKLGKQNNWSRARALFKRESDNSSMFQIQPNLKG